MAVRRIAWACAVALFLSACGNVKPDWGFEEKVDWDIGEGLNADTDGDAGEAPTDPCADPDAGACDPLTNAGCDGDAGYACSFHDETEGSFACLSDSTEPEGSPCDAADGPWCGPALACAPGDGGSGVCVPFCCGADECGDGPCTPFDYPSVEGPFGFCSPESPDAGI
jgi:hypothetical protein